MNKLKHLSVGLLVLVVITGCDESKYKRPMLITEQPQPLSSVNHSSDVVNPASILAKHKHNSKS